MTPWFSSTRPRTFWKSLSSVPTAPAASTVLPVPDIVPPDQSRVPVTVTVSEPVNSPKESSREEVVIDSPLARCRKPPSITTVPTAVTMAFAVMGISTILSGFAMRHTTQPAYADLTTRFAGTLLAGGLIVILATEFGFLQQWLLTVPLTGPQWAAVLGLALVMPLIVEIDKLVQRLRTHRAPSTAPSSMQ